MGYSPLRRELLAAVPMVFLLACKNNQQTLPSRAELEKNGIITPQPTKAPDPKLGNPVVPNNNELMDTILRPVQWDFDYQNQLGFQFRALTKSQRGIGYDGVLHVLVPIEAFRAQADILSSQPLVDNPSDNLHASIQLHRLDNNMRNFDLTLALRSDAPTTSVDFVRSIVDTHNVTRAPDAWLLACQYRNKIFYGEPYIGSVTMNR